MNDTKTLTKIALIVGLLLDWIDEIEVNKLWFRKLKQIGLRFKKELEYHDKIIIGDADPETSQQFVDGYQSLNNLINFNLSLSDNQLKYFNEDLNELIKKYESTETSNTK
jgi:hypothetical protein